MANIALGRGRQDFLFDRDGEDNTITDFRSLYFQSTLDEAQEVPPNPDIPTIDGTGTGALNFRGTRFEFSLDINGIDLAGGPAPDDMTDMHIHGAPVGATGPVIFDFRNDTETVVNAVAGTVVGGWDVNEAVALDLTAANLAALLAGDTYFNIHTNRDATGFIRGQILRDGTALDRIDLRDLNIGSLASLQAITTRSAGDAVITAFLDDDASVLRLDGVGKPALEARHVIFAGGVAESIGGSLGRDDLFGAGGNDTIDGRAGNDRLFGEPGADTLLGKLGFDALTGGLGEDLLTGGANRDRFVFKSLNDSGNTAATADRVTDFRADFDHMVLSVIDASAATAGNQAFTFIDSDQFDAEGQLRVTHGNAGNTFVSLNTAGTSGAEMVIRLDGDITVSDADFIL